MATLSDPVRLRVDLRAGGAAALRWLPVSGTFALLSWTAAQDAGFALTGSAGLAVTGAILFGLDAGLVFGSVARMRCRHDAGRALPADLARLGRLGLRRHRWGVVAVAGAVLAVGAGLGWLMAWRALLAALLGFAACMGGVAVAMAWFRVAPERAAAIGFAPVNAGLARNVAAARARLSPPDLVSTIERGAFAATSWSAPVRELRGLRDDARAFWPSLSALPGLTPGARLRAAAAGLGGLWLPAAMSAVLAVTATLILPRDLLGGVMPRGGMPVADVGAPPEPEEAPAEEEAVPPEDGQDPGAGGDEARTDGQSADDGVGDGEGVAGDDGPAPSATGAPGGSGETAAAEADSGAAEAGDEAEAGDAGPDGGDPSEAGEGDPDTDRGGPSADAPGDGPEGEGETPGTSGDGTPQAEDTSSSDAAEGPADGSAMPGQGAGDAAGEDDAQPEAGPGNGEAGPSDPQPEAAAPAADPADGPADGPGEADAAPAGGGDGGGDGKQGEEAPANLATVVQGTEDATGAEATVLMGSTEDGTGVPGSVSIGAPGGDGTGDDAPVQAGIAEAFGAPGAVPPAVEAVPLTPPDTPSQPVDGPPPGQRLPAWVSELFQ